LYCSWKQNVYIDSSCDQNLFIQAKCLKQKNIYWNIIFSYLPATFFYFSAAVRYMYFRLFLILSWYLHEGPSQRNQIVFLLWVISLFMRACLPVMTFRYSNTLTQPKRKLTFNDSFPLIYHYHCLRLTLHTHESWLPWDWERTNNLN
jgi:hypothetical protein